MEVLQNNIKPIGQLSSPLSLYEKSFFNELANNLSNNLNQNGTIERASARIICANLPKADYNRIALISVHGDPAVDFGKEEAGGQNVYVRNLGEELAKLGYDVDMFTRKVSPSQQTIVNHSSNCRTIRLQAGPISFIGRDNLFQYAPDFVNSFLKFQEENNVHYPIVHTNYWISGWVGLQLRKIQGSKQLHTYHSLGCIKYISVDNIPEVAETRLKFEKEVLENAEYIIATSPEEERDMRTYMSDKGNIKMVPCGTDIDRFNAVNREQARKQLNFKQTDKIVLYVGRFDYRKGIETLVRAVNMSKFRNDSNLKLVIGGGWTEGGSDGKERERIGQIVKECNLEDITIFPGQLGPSNLHLYFAAADCCVVPSHYEPFGLVPIEAMASSTPVVGSDVGGLKYTIVNGMTGYLCPPKNNGAFAEAIDKILSSTEVRDKLAKQGLERVRGLFKWQSVSIKLSKLYNELVDEFEKERY